MAKLSVAMDTSRQVLATPSEQRKQTVLPLALRQKPRVHLWQSVAERWLPRLVAQPAQWTNHMR